ncbi:MAG: hypothetical protein E2591_27110 [Achromobacter sp.]|uniref:hypothetical protein n=1 Tax=Achromobacter sp. TaxID=134375 RepID=UPI0012D128AB|nr:hypothetical protein [Achromobacter sp.]MPS81746.1 hypothetical protein [Achromobacter sp.]
MPQHDPGPECEAHHLDNRGRGAAMDVSYAPYFNATAKLLRDVAAAAFSAAMHQSARPQLAMAVDVLTQHAAAWRNGEANQSRYRARFAGRSLVTSIPSLTQGVDWAKGLLDGAARQRKLVAADERLAGLLVLERCVRGAAALEAAHSDAGSIGELAWTQFERQSRWVFEASIRVNGSDWATAACGEDLLRTAREAAITAICNRPSTTWSMAQFSRAALLVPVSRAGGLVRLDETARSVEGQVGARLLAEEHCRHQRAGGRVSAPAFHDMLRSHLERCTNSDLEVVLMAGMRPIVFFAGEMGVPDLNAALRAVTASVGIRS